MELDNIPGEAARCRSHRPPAFILSCIRSGSTLLRCILNSHSRVYAPHEIHLRDLRVSSASEYSTRSLRALGIGHDELEHILWCGLLRTLLERSGKELLVEKTPSNVFNWRRIDRLWPSAPIIFLTRDPHAVADSAIRCQAEVNPNWRPELAVDTVARFLSGLAGAMESLDGLTVRYEDLTKRPEQVLRGACDYLGIDWEPGMMEYGSFYHGPKQYGLGDTTTKIDAGRVLPARRRPLRIWPQLAGVSARLGYFR